MLSEKTRDYGIDIAKIFAMLGVLSLHILGKDFVQNTTIYQTGMGGGNTYTDPFNSIFLFR